MLRFSQVSLHRGGRTLFADLSFTLHPGWKCGVAGANGSGKSSLFALVRGALHPDGGTLALPPAWTIAHVAQEVAAGERAAIDYVLDGDAELRAIEAELERARAAGDGLQEAALHARLDVIDAWTARARAARLLAGLGFAPGDEPRPVRDFSGGWRMRLNLAQALMCRSDLLLLDEPTNHLDLDAVLWLEDWLRAYPGTLLLISHDRDFLDRVADHILHLEARAEAARATLYTGNYSAFERARAAELAREQAASEKQRREAAHMRDFVERFRAKASKARQAQSRLKMLERMPEIAAAHVDSPFHFEFRAPEKLPAPLLVLKDGAAGYGDITILSGVNLSLAPSDRVGLLGPNGAGKSTLIRLLAGELALRSGERIGARDLKIGYFAQHQLEQLHLDDNALTHLTRLDPRAREQELRDFLGGFGFVGDRVLEPVAPFSGGEKARLVLALLVYQRPNLLLLDEPTNYLDLDMRHALGLALQDYAGALVVVSHDRYLLQSVTDRLLRVADGRATAFDGDLDEYAAWLARRRSRAPAAGAPAATTNRKEQRRQDAERRRQLQPLKARLQALEAELERLSAAKARIEAALADGALYSGAEKDKLKALLLEQGRVQQALAAAETAWLEAGEELEAANRAEPAA
jgi:ATP-binding cassette subfamily F protein 3